MKPWITFLLFLISHTLVFGQVSDDFSDGTLALDPVWSGDTNRFIHQQGLLRSQALSGSFPLIGTALPANLKQVEWKFFVNLRLATSSNNLLWVCLMCDSLRKNDSMYGLGLRIGGTPDDIQLYRLEGKKRILLADGPDNRLNSSTDNQLDFHILLDSAQNLTVKSRAGNERSYREELKAFTNTRLQSGFFGLYFVFSGTNATNFYFDNLCIREYYPDQQAPALQKARFVNSREIFLDWNEPVQSVSLVNLNRDSLLVFSGLETSQLRLFLPTPAQAGVNTLRLKGVRDENGNSMDTSFQLNFRPPRPGTIRISEIMADPAPARNLPEVEYLELFHAGSDTADLHLLQFMEDNQWLHFPEIQIIPGQQVLISNAQGCRSFPPDISCFSLFQGNNILNNSGEFLALFNSDSILIDSLTFSPAWHDSAGTMSGGVSLELINPTDSCARWRKNWGSSGNPDGGTPGRENQRTNLQPDLSAPQLVSQRLVDSLTLELVFDESSLNIHELSWNAKDPVPGWGELAGGKLRIHFSRPFTPDPWLIHRYFFHGIRDCSGNEFRDTVIFRYASSRSPQAYEMLISEILVKPKGAQSRFVELKNRSNDGLCLESLCLKQGNKIWPLPPLVIYPEETMVFCDKTMGSFQTIPGLAQLSPQSGTLSLALGNEIIDAVAYSPGDYENGLKSMGGYSLERREDADWCEQKENWRASGSEGGTPGISEPFPNPYINKTLEARAFLLDSTTLRVVFSRAVIHPGKPAPEWHRDTPRLSDGSRLRFDYSLKEPVEPGRLYSLRLDSVKSCGGLPVNLQLKAGLPENPKDILFSEILFNPHPGEKDYLEIFHAGTDVCDIASCYLTEWGGKNPIRIHSEPFLVFPGEYLVLGTDSSSLRKRFPGLGWQQFLPVTGLPSLPDDGGTVWLMDSSGRLIDSNHWTEQEHHPLLLQTEGVSLERINLTPDEKGYWQSASLASGYGTPGGPNSQTKPDSGTERWVLTSPYLSPDGDGLEDYIILSYQDLKPGCSADLDVFNLAGEKIAEVYHSYLSGVTGILSWDGLNEKGIRVLPGVYLLQLRVDEPGKPLQCLRFAIMIT